MCIRVTHSYNIRVYSFYIEYRINIVVTGPIGQNIIYYNNLRYYTNILYNIVQYFVDYIKHNFQLKVYHTLSPTPPIGLNKLNNRV